MYAGSEKQNRNYVFSQKTFSSCQSCPCKDCKRDFSSGGNWP